MWFVVNTNISAYSDYGVAYSESDDSVMNMGMEYNVVGFLPPASTNSAPEPEILRSVFPETWLWGMFEVRLV